MRRLIITHVSLNVEVLKVESVLPDVNPDDRDEGQQRVLVWCRCDLEALGGRIQTLDTKDH